MKIEDLALVKRIFEGALMAAERPLQRRDLTELFDDLETPADALIDQALVELDSDCEARGYELKRVASGYRYQVKQDLSRWVNKLWQERAPRYSRALLETMSLVAYRQPITRGEIEQIRGVAVSTQIIKTLLEREWIKSVGYRDAPGRPAIYATTRQFLDYFNLKSLDQLPPLAEIRDLNTISRELNIELPVEEIKPANDESNEADIVDLPVTPAVENADETVVDAEAVDNDAADDLEVQASDSESIELDAADSEAAEIESADIESADIAETIEASNLETANLETGNASGSEIDAFASWIDDELTEEDDVVSTRQSSEENQEEMQASNRASGEVKF
ncbi:MAG: SMC-Scp complex subunit ScpB [Cellvibrionales bacterium]|jgi:segregation and condensation protein B|nr:SMC-Scp complex subunit ScpB [Cellvibrionales bacterium]